MINLDIKGPFNLKYTFESGQPLAFFGDYKLDNNNEFLSYPTTKGIFYITMNNNSLSYEFYGDYADEDARKEIIDRLGLNDDLNYIYSKINTDSYIENAIRNLYGLRVTKNDPFETIVVFVISQQNNIKRIRKITLNLIEKFGKQLNIRNENKKLFPDLEDLRKASLNDFLSLGLGFRSKYLYSIVNSIDYDFINEINKLNYNEAKNRLMELEGIGDKVADCILLFGYKRLEAFPIDTWVKKAMEEHYLLKKANVKEIHEYANKKWNNLAGYAQQYLFWYKRNS